MSALTRLRTVFAAGNQEKAPYECLGCGTCFTMQRQVCPECGSYSIERTDWASQRAAE